MAHKHSTLCGSFDGLFKASRPPNPLLTGGPKQLFSSMSPPAAKFLKSLINRLNKRVLAALEAKADVIWPEKRGAKRIRYPLSRWHTLPTETVFWELNSDDKNKKTGHGL